jgi:nucleotide-binding universal stress UspA family protein
LVFLGTLIDALIYLNDENERTEECVSIRACYLPPPSTHTSSQASPAAVNEAAKRDAEIAIAKVRRAADSGNQAMATQAGAETQAPVAEAEAEAEAEALAVEAEVEAPAAETEAEVEALAAETEAEVEALATEAQA